MNSHPSLDDSRSPYTGYLFSYFAGESYPDGEQVYFAVSRDGLNWQDLNRNAPVLFSTVGRKGVRDPVVVRSATGAGFWIIATDECIHTDGDWNKAQTAASRGIVVWESPDLVAWSEARLVLVSRYDAGCTWAPEATWMPQTGEYLVYWASTIAEDCFQKQRIYCARTRDFRTFSAPEVYIEGDKHIIDTTIIECDGIYYRYSRDDVHGCIVADSVETLTSRVARRIPAPHLEAQPRVEGPFAFKFNGQRRWCLLIDNHVGVGYYPLVSTDLASGVFAPPSEPYRMPTRARHGGVLPVTEEEYVSLLQKWGPS